MELSDKDLESVVGGLGSLGTMLAGKTPMVAKKERAGRQVPIRTSVPQSAPAPSSSGGTCGPMGCTA